eukprot:scaffold54055_cov13-Tisochrysis_lutea.AAC.1
MGARKQLGDSRPPLLQGELLCSTPACHEFSSSVKEEYNFILGALALLHWEQGLLSIMLCLKDKFVPLPEEADAEEQAAQAAAAEVLAPHPTQVPLEWHERPAIFEDLPQLGVLPPPLPDSSKRGRATLYCIAESFDRKKLEELLKLTYPAEQVLSYPDVFY